MPSLVRFTPLKKYLELHGWRLARTTYSRDRERADRWSCPCMVERLIRSMSSKRKSAANDAPFKARLLWEARRVVNEYRFAFWREEGRYVGQCVEMDTLGIGKSVSQCIARARALAVSGVAALLEAGDRPPLPARTQARNVQIDIRLSPDEKRAIEEAASKGGFRGISDYLRIRGLAMA